MKLVTAIIQPDKLDEVREALISVGIERITVSRVAGHGQQEDMDLYRGHEVEPSLLPKVRLDIACSTAKFVNLTVKTILNTAKHGKNGKIGDGKIFVTPLEQCYRIRTKESGPKAI